MSPATMAQKRFALDTLLCAALQASSPYLDTCPKVVEQVHMTYNFANLVNL